MLKEYHQSEKEKEKKKTRPTTNNNVAPDFTSQY